MRRAAKVPVPWRAWGCALGLAGSSACAGDPTATDASLTHASDAGSTQSDAQAGGRDAASTAVSGGSDSGSTSDMDAGGRDASRDARAAADETHEGGTGGGTGDVYVPALCIQNPSVEGTAGEPLPAPWQVCSGTPSLGPVASGFPASDGENYLSVVGKDPAFDEPDRANVPLCEPLPAGSQVAMRLDLSIPITGGAIMQGSMRIYGASSACGPRELLWESASFGQSSVWLPHCATLTPTRETTHLIFEPGATNFTGFGIDHLRPTEHCE